jgi:xanthine permease XanP
MKKPLNIVYGVDETPPLGVTLVSGFQHVVLMSIRLLFPLLVAREAGLPPERVLDVVAVSMLVMGLGAYLQSLPARPVGSGYLCPASFTSAYIAPSIAAARTGGLALVLGMTVFGGLIETALSRVLRPLRPFFPPEIAGFVVLVVGVTLGALGTRNLLGIGGAEQARGPDLAVAAVSLTTMVALNVWGTGLARVCCALVGMIAGYAAAGVAGILTAADFRAVAEAPFFHIPSLAHPMWRFDVALAIPFGVAALAACLRAMGDVTTCQKMNDAEWMRPSLRSLSGGVLANGIGTTAAGLLGTIGINTLTSSVGLAAATGVASRRIAHVIAGMFLGLAFLPKAAALFAIMPRPVLGATLLFSAAFVFINGLQIITSRMLDIRKTLVIGLSFMVGLSVDLYPAFFTALPAGAHPFVSSSLVLGTVTALLLNLAFRAGVRRTQTLSVEPGPVDSERITDFMEAQGATWGARRDIIDRASFNLAQSIETIVDGCAPEGPLEIQASFDEFNLDLRVSYDGAPLDLPERRPTNEEIIASEEGQRKLAGFMLRRHADRVQSSHRGGRSTILFHFDH